MNEVIANVICCPACHGQLRSRRHRLECDTCRVTYRIQNGVPVFFPEEVIAVSSDHVSNPIGADFEELLRKGDGVILHIGAGATPQKYPTCIEFEHKIFKHTDVVGDAHQLPFRDGSFDRVFAFNVFEHLREPARAAAEVARVLKPGGMVAIHTAFLQAVHEEPAHFYNTTEYGLRRWFADFEIEKLTVSPNFSPGIMIAYLMSSVVNVLRESGVALREQAAVQETTLGEWADFWAAGLREPPDGFHILQNLPQAAQKKIAAGFELIGRKPIRQ
jgi:SAM-dependent methyltransferase